ncbi:hypothetical protein [Flavobacterium sp.]|uniref:hypothetical protein n=1 Tax=Flavobacterium sp. TaxID=239 RepID=UPI00374D5772
MKVLDVNQPVWLKIWSESLSVTKNLAYGIENSSSTFEKVLTLIDKGIAVPERILVLFSDSVFSDLSGYQDREKIWQNLPLVHIQKFQKATAVGCMKKILDGRLTIDKVEQEIKTILSGNDFISTFLSENRSNINSVLIAFSTISDLKDKHLSDYIYYFNEI